VRLEASPALVLPPQVIELAGQSFDGPCDIPNIIAGDGSLAVGRYGRLIGFAPRIWAVWQPIALVAQAEGVPEPKVGAAAVRIAPEGWGVLSHNRSRAEEAGDQDHGSHGHSMTRELGSVEDSHG
jgi:hypothetical protein